VWVLGQKTEHVAINVVTSDSGRTEILGGFFRDHQGSSGVPYFITENGAQLLANWVQFAHCPGATRALQAKEGRRNETRDLSIKAASGVVGHYRSH